MKIKVSIIVPFYKDVYLLNRAINSILKQSYKNYEIIIINDNPKEKLFSFLKKNKSKKKIKVIYNKKNLGAGLSRNKGIKNSKGKYIAFLDSDDTWHKHKLLKQINFMEKNKYLASHTSYEKVDTYGKYLATRFAYDLDYNKLVNSCDIGLSTVILNKKILQNKSLFPSIKTKEDYVLWLKIAKSGIIFYGMSSILTKWQNTPNSLSKSILQKLKDSFTVYNKYENFNFIKSIYRVLILSLNFLFKNL